MTRTEDIWVTLDRRVRISRRRDHKDDGTEGVPTPRGMPERTGDRTASRQCAAIFIIEELRALLTRNDTGS